MLAGRGWLRGVITVILLYECKLYDCHTVGGVTHTRIIFWFGLDYTSNYKFLLHNYI